MKANFIDHIRIWVKSGDGGAGSAHFRRERFVPKGGPDGGNGGNGGSIILVGDNQLNTLLHLRYRKHIIAENGTAGQGSHKFGENAQNIFVKVPLGTQIKVDEEKETENIEILEHGQEYIIAKGGKGGLGNSNFKSPTNQSPRYAQPGLPGEEKWISLELKLLADVGLVGLPNAGKSSLLASISAAKPKIANYPFTTLIPNVGVVKYYDKTFVMADIPGIMSGAAEGKGLGTRFLRHIERNAILLFVIDSESPSIKETYNLLINELKKHNKDLLFKDKLIAISKSDLLDQEMMKEIIKKDLPKNIDYVFISSKTKLGLQELKNKLWALIKEEQSLH